MREYRVHMDISNHTGMLDGAFLETAKHTMKDVPVLIRTAGEYRILEMISNATMGTDATFIIGHDQITLALNEDQGPNYVVEYDKRHNTHTFPSNPPVRIDLVDF